ncbi:MAG: dihydroorotate dehydrogenase [Prevotellaceae bacterium]|nr:dihydroorotate dehydrogenase [Prevotellaceae bacterium]
MVNISVNLCGIGLQNPIIPASGTFGYGKEFCDFYDINILGAISIKGTTKEPRYGNPQPRIAECYSGMINSVGLQNPGIDAVVGKQIPDLRKFYHQPIVANISGFSVDEYMECCRKIDSLADIIEVNISCPNVHNGGMSFGTDPASAAMITKAVKSVTTKPVFVKLTPNVTDIVSIAKACEDAGADGLTLINTLLGMRIDIKRRKPVLTNKMGGFSGPAVFPIAVRMVYQVAKACSIPIIGCGGISTTDDVIEMMMAGATAVEIGTANLIEPMTCKTIIDKLPNRLLELGFNNINDIIGII